MNDVYPDVPTLGRPRSHETIQRDEWVLGILSSGSKSRNAIHSILSEGYEKNVSRSQVWLSLDRLRKQGRVKLCQGNGERVWSADVDNPCP